MRDWFNSLPVFLILQFNPPNHIARPFDPHLSLENVDIRHPELSIMSDIPFIFIPVELIMHQSSNCGSVCGNEIIYSSIHTHQA